MVEDCKMNDGINTFVVSERFFTVYQINTLYSKFKNILGQNLPITIIMDSVEVIDAIGLQLLISLRKSAANKGLSFRCKGWKQHVEVFLIRAGVDENIFKIN